MASRIRVVISIVLVVAVFAGLLWSTLQEGTEYYKHVDEVMASPKQWHNKSLQLHGFVVPGSIMMRQGTLEYKFQIQNQGSVLNVFYTGIVPDTFGDGAEVVLKGRLIDQNFNVSPNGVMAKCPSKYKAK